MASDFRAKKVHFATGNEKAITSLFKKQPPKALTLQQFEARLVTAQARLLSILVERWPASHRSFPVPKGQPQTMHGGCGGLWMELHGHTSIIGVQEFNGQNKTERGLWFQRRSDGGKKLTGKQLTDAEDLFRAELIEGLREKWRNEEEKLLSTLPSVILAAEVRTC
jgi:hypothetical protein